MALTPCPRCARHVRSIDRACPFCARPSRAMLAIAGTALAMSGCELAGHATAQVSDEPERMTPQYGAPSYDPPPPPQPQPASPIDAGPRNARRR